MKVKISNYRRSLRSSIHQKYIEKKYGFIWPENAEFTKFEKALEVVEDSLNWLYNNLYNRWFVWSKPSRKISIQISRDDVIGANETISLIAFHVMKRFQEERNKSAWKGVFFVDDVDLPKHIIEMRDDEDTPWAVKKSIVSNEYVLNEIIFAFSCVSGALGDLDIAEENARGHQERVDNGLRLFAKYLDAFWI